MKIIDLLNKIANGEEVPKVIKKQWKYEWQYDETREEYTYMQETGERFDDDWLVINMLNDKVEILEEEPYVEVCGSWFTKSEYDKLFLEEENKIPEKLEETSNIGDLTITYPSNKELMKKINEIIDYLKSKGE